MLFSFYNHLLGRCTDFLHQDSGCKRAIVNLRLLKLFKIINQINIHVNLLFIDI